MEPDAQEAPEVLSVSGLCADQARGKTMLSVNHEVAAGHDETVVVTGVCGFVGAGQCPAGSWPTSPTAGAPYFQLVVASPQDAGQANEGSWDYPAED